MKKKRNISQKLVVTIASATLSSCIGAVDPAPPPTATATPTSGPPFGAVDPAPPPLECTTVDKGQSLTIIDQKLEGLDVTFTINNTFYASWSGKPVISVSQGFTLVSTEIPEVFQNNLVVKLKLDSAEITKGELTLEGTMLDRYGQKTCPVKRVFQLSIEKTIKVSQYINDIPLDINNRVAIAILNRNGTEIELSGNTTENVKNFNWSVEEGSIEKKTSTSAIWRLPEKPGLYQVELVVDHEDDSFSYDTLFVELA